MAISARAIAAGTAMVLSVAVLTACSPGSSVEAYCGVIAEHKDRYLAAMGEVNAGDNPLAGMVGMVSALGDLNRMWEEAAKVAPEEIQTDVEAVRDAWASQFEAAEKAASDPLGGLASALMTGFQAAAATQRVDEYTAQNCPDVAGMFVSSAPQEPSAAQEDTLVDHEIATEPSASARVVELQGWRPFGPFMLSGPGSDTGAAQGAVTLYVPETGEEIELDMDDLLPGEEVMGQEFGYGYDREAPFVIGMAQIRIPASGLEPEKFIHSLLRIEADAPLVAVARVDIDEPGTFSLDGSSRDGIVLLRRDSEELPERQETMAVDLVSESLAWRRPGIAYTGFGVPDRVLLAYSALGSGSCWNRYQGDSVAYVVDVRSAEELWRTEEAPNDCSGPEFEDVLGDRFAVYGTDSDTSENAVQSVATGSMFVFDQSIGGIDPLTSLAWGYPYAEFGASSGDLQVVDLATGTVVYRVDRERANALQLQPESLYDGVLYVTTTDEQLAIDVRTGEEIGTWEEYPLAAVGASVWMSDETLRLEWQEGR